MGHAELEPEDIDESISPLYGALKRTWASFCATTSIHGLKYTRDQEANHIVRSIWMLITIVMFICAIVMVITFYVDYRSNPTRMNIESDHASIKNLLFPSITVCPAVVFNMEKSKPYIDTLKLPEFSHANDVIDALRITYGFMYDDERFESKEIELMENILLINNLTIEEFINHVRWKCDDIIYRCRFDGQIIKCSELFEVSHTAYGHCCSFNLNQSGIIFHKKYASAGLRNGLSLVLRYNDKNYDKLRSYSHGFRLLLNENLAYPGGHAIAKFVPLNEETFISVRPEEVVCSTAVKQLSVDERQCVFKDEFHLNHFWYYVGANCVLDSRVNNMVKYCGCLTYFFESNRQEDRLCTFKDIPCLIDRYADSIGRFRNTQDICPNSCEMTNYDVQVTSTILQVDAPTIDSFYDGIKEDFSVAHVFMNSYVYRKVRRDLLSNMVTLVSNLGSAFSLFVGMSMVSAVEIFYYFSVVLRKNYLQEVKAREKLLFNKNAKVSTIMTEETTAGN